MLWMVLAVAVIEGCRLAAMKTPKPSWPPLVIASLPGVLVAAAGAVTLAVLTTPPVMVDALNYHLAFPARWLAAGGFVEFPRHYFSYYPSAHGTLYGFALATVGPWGAAAIHWWFGALAVLAAGELGGRLGGERAASWAAACFALTPVVLEVAGYPIADLPVAAWMGAALVALTVESDAPRWKIAAAVGVLAGTAAAAKYLALATALAPVFLAAVIVFMRPSLRDAAIPLAALVIGAFIVVAPWILRNAAWTSNPVYPYFQEVLGGPPVERDIARELIVTEDVRDTVRSPAVRTLAAPVIRTFQPLKSGGFMGPHWLILLPVALMVPVIRTRHAAVLWMATLASALAWGATVHYARFLIPAMVPASALAGAAAAALTSPGSSRLVSRLFSVLLLVVFGWNATVLASKFQIDRISVVAGQLSDDDFRARWISYAPAIEPVKTQLPPDAVVMLVAEPRSLYLERAVLVEDPYRVPLLVELAAESSDPAELADRVRSLGATHVLVNSSEMEFYGRVRGKDGYWSDATPEQLRIIETFLAEYLSPIVQTDTLLLGEIVDAP
jgi:4-amino-4-deoxy-L-arabinose transferase-like glycosyltransferase